MMNEGSQNIVVTKSYALALQVIDTYKFLVGNAKEFILSKQLLRAGTSIGANVNEAISGETKKDFVHKLGIALKQARETYYWLCLLKDAKFLEIEKAAKLINLCQELIRIISSIILTTRQKYFPSPILNS